MMKLALAVVPILVVACLWLGALEMRAQTNAKEISALRSKLGGLHEMKADVAALREGQDGIQEQVSDLRTRLIRKGIAQKPGPAFKTKP